MTGWCGPVKLQSVTRGVTVELPEEVVWNFGSDESRFARELLETAVIKWYEKGRISSGKDAELLGIGRADFLDLLLCHKVSQFQSTPEELQQELKGA